MCDELAPRTTEHIDYNAYIHINIHIYICVCVRLFIYLHIHIQIQRRDHIYMLLLLLLFELLLHIKKNIYIYICNIYIDINCNHINNIINRPVCVCVSMDMQYIIHEQKCIEYRNVGMSFKIEIKGAFLDAFRSMA